MRALRLSLAPFAVKVLLSPQRDTKRAAKDAKEKLNLSSACTTTLLCTLTDHLLTAEYYGAKYPVRSAMKCVDDDAKIPKAPSPLPKPTVKALGTTCPAT